MESQRVWSSFFSKPLSLSVQVPVTWEVASNDDFTLLLIAPEENGFKANIGINGYSFTGEKKDFEKTIEQFKVDLQSDYPEYKLLSEEECWIDGYPAYHQLYSWYSNEQDCIVFQTLSLICDTQTRLYQVNGTCLEGQNSKILNLIEKIAGSVRIIF